MANGRRVSRPKHRRRRLESYDVCFTVLAVAVGCVGACQSGGAWMLLVLLGSSASARAGTVPAGFTDSVAMAGWRIRRPCGSRPDGRVFVAEKSGLIKVFDASPTRRRRSSPTSGRRSTTSGTAACSGWRSTRASRRKPYVYVLYTYDAPIGGQRRAGARRA